MQERTTTERLRVASDRTLSEVKRLIHEGNVRRLIIRNQEERVLVEIPLTVGAVGVLVAPVAAAIGAVAALATHCTIEIERVATPQPTQEAYGPANFAPSAATSPAQPLTEDTPNAPADDQPTTASRPASTP